MHATGAAGFRERRHHALVHELGLAAAAALTYFGIRNLTAGAADEAMANADRLARLERRRRIASPSEAPIAGAGAAASAKFDFGGSFLLAVALDGMLSP